MNKRQKKLFALGLRTRMDATGIKQKDLTSITGATAQAVSRWFRGGGANEHHVMKIARHFSVDYPILNAEGRFVEIIDVPDGPDQSTIISIHKKLKKLNEHNRKVILAETILLLESQQFSPLAPDLVETLRE